MINYRSRRLEKQITQIILLTFLYLGVVMSWCYAQPVSSTELINDAKKYDGTIVVYRGEVIGDIMPRGEYAWVNVNDGKNAIGIWIKEELTEDIIYAGSYKTSGDLVEVKGRFNRACIEHGGDLDIHAQAITKLSPGNIIYHGLKPEQIYLALGLLLTILLTYLLRIIVSHRKTRLPK